MKGHDEYTGSSSVRHTQYAFYLTTIFAMSCIIYDSTQGIIQRYHFSKKWFWLYGVMCLFAYLYTRPLIRKRLGSASAGYINWTTVYAVWLCAAVFYHLPSLDSLGLDVRADVSMLITVFLGSLVALGILSASYGAAVLFRLLSPRLFDRAGTREVFTTIILNATTLAIACSSYYSLCGNAAAYTTTTGIPRTSASYNNTNTTDSVRLNVCGKWLHPLSAIRHPSFSAWVIYGESSSNTTSTTSVEAGPSAQLISPVLTIWLTLFSMTLVNSVADYAAGAAFSAAYSSEARRGLLSAKRRASRRLSRRRSAEFPSTDRLRLGFGSAAGSYASLGFLSRSGSKAGGLDAILKTVSSVGSLWSPTSLESMGLKAASALLFRDDFSVGLTPATATTTTHTHIDGVDDATPVSESLVRNPEAAAGVGLSVNPEAPAPSFLPMFPWYSGTSADLIKTLFDLMVSVKVFLGRFDARTMQAATATTPSATSDLAAPPRDGDGFTFEHLANQDDVWIDFTGDTGDGGDSTYSIARCLAAPSVAVEVPKEMMLAAGAPPSITSKTTKVLPRATCFVHGGDLAYPNPTDETYEQRLFGPYEDAMPPPAHIHPGNLVVNKPDVPPECWTSSTTTGAASTAAKVNGGGSVVDCSCQSRMKKEGGGATRCHLCRKSQALAAYEGPSAFLIPGVRFVVAVLFLFFTSTSTLLGLLTTIQLLCVCTYRITIGLMV